MLAELMGDVEFLQMLLRVDGSFCRFAVGDEDNVAITLCKCRCGQSALRGSKDGDLHTANLPQRGETGEGGELPVIGEKNEVF